MVRVRVRVRVLAFISLLAVCCGLQWVPHEVYRQFLERFDKLENERTSVNHRGTDMRPSTPFITGNGFRALTPHICDDMNRCRVATDTIQNGSCIFIKTDLFEMFVINILPNIPGTYRLITHNGDLSAPDGQDDAPRIGMPRYVVSHTLTKEYEAGRLISHHGQNLWWKNYTFSPRPAWSHCLPIGFENRQWKIGKNIKVYADTIRELILSKPMPTLAELDARPLLLIAFYPKSRCPDRQKVLSIIGALPPRGQPKPVNPWYNETDLNHAEWLTGIVEHKFVLAPFGHGLDTHRVSEILMMGGIPVMRKSTIASCYDDSDNVFGTTSRGGLPIAWLDSWNDLTKERLESEWQRLRAVPRETWDWKRLFMDHWAERVGCPQLHYRWKQA